MNWEAGGEVVRVDYPIHPRGYRVIHINTVTMSRGPHQLPAKIILKSTTHQTLNDRFAEIARRTPKSPPQVTITGIRSDQAQLSQASAKNRRLAAQMARRTGLQDVVTGGQKQSLQSRLGSPRGGGARKGLNGRIGTQRGGSQVGSGFRRGGFGSSGRGRGAVRGGRGFGRGSGGSFGRGGGGGGFGKRGSGFGRGSRGNRGNTVGRGGGGVARGGRGRGRGRGRGGVKPVSRDALDAELDQYMSKTKSHLDHELDDYMMQAGSTEN